MATTLTNTRRASQETERRHLLSPSQPQSLAPSAASSVIHLPTSADDNLPTASGTTTSGARSPAPETQQKRQQQAPRQAYRGFASEAAYLAALREWADSKKFLEPDTGLQGFYGSVTGREYAERPGLGGGGLGLRKKWKLRTERGVRDGEWGRG